MANQTLFRWGGLISIVTAALLVITTIVNFYPLSVVGQWLFIATAVFLVFTMMALYSAQAGKSGVLGLVGFVLTIIGSVFLAIGSFVVLARVSGIEEAKAVVKFWSTTVVGSAPLLLGLGLILFGIATVRAHVYPRWAGMLLNIGVVLLTITGMSTLLLQNILIVSGVLSVIALAIASVGLGWMGWVLWSSKGEMT